MDSKLHFMGIGGVGMAALAALLRWRGREVSGCDLKPTPRTAWLEGLGIPVAYGHDPAHLEGVGELVVTPAVARDEAELVAARRRGLCVRSRGEVLAELVNAAADSIVVCGSHGKTTTSTYLARLLLALGEKVAWAIGGETGDFHVAGGGDFDWRREGVLVAEGDESDGTLARYRAKTLVVTNVEYDHPDHFPTPADYEACFNAARRQAGRVFEGGAVGTEGLPSDPNAALAFRVALARGHAAAAIREALAAIADDLPDRRFQKLAEGVYADYAHHPTEIRYALNRARARTRGKLRVLFQPHRYSRTAALKADFARALALADEVVICPTYSAFERPVPHGDSADLYLEMRTRETELGHCGEWLFLSRSCAEAWEHARNCRAEGDLTLLLGAGDIIELKERLDLPQTVRRIYIGQGTNLFQSDLRLDVEYVKSESPAGRSGAALLADPAVAPLMPFMAGIPGTLGGWVKMNAGAHGHSISEALEAVKVDGRWIPAADCGFGYRTSAIGGEIQDVRWLAGDAACALAATLESATAYLARRRKFPAGTYGSVFKNPPGDYAGRLLETAGAKTLRVGGARVWSEHANVIVRGAGCRPSDVLALARLMRNAVFHRHGLILAPEVVGL